MKNKLLKIFILSVMTVGIAFPIFHTIDAQAKVVKPTEIRTVTSKNKKKTQQILALGEIRAVKSAGKVGTINVILSPKKSSRGLRLTSDNNDVVRVYRKNKGGTSWTMMGIGKGDANVTIRSTVKSSLKTNIKVHVRSKAPTYLNLSQSSITMNENETGSIGAMEKDATVNVTFNSNTVDRFINVESSDPAIVSVTSKNSKHWDFRAQKAGTATITVSSASKGSINQQFTVTVKSPTVITAFAAKQKSDKEVEVTFSSPQTSVVQTGNFSIKQKNANWPFALVKCTVANDRKSCVLEGAIPFQKGAEYEIIYTPTGSTTPQTTAFTASTGKVEKIVLKTTTVVANVPRKIEVEAFDDRGINITDSNILNNITVKLNNNAQGYYDSFSHQLTMWVAGTSAPVTLVYNIPGAYTNGVQNTITATGTINCVSASSLNYTLDKFTLVNSSKGILSDADWSQVSNTNVLTLPVGITNEKLVVRVKSSDGSYYSSDKPQNAVFTFTSLNPSLISAQSDGTLNVTNQQQIGNQTFIKIGLTIAGSTTQYTVPVQVGAASIPNGITISPSQFQNISPNNKQVVFKLTMKDQYGNNITPQANSYISIVPSNNNSVSSYQPIISSQSYNQSTGTYDITFTGTSYPALNSPQSSAGYTFNIVNVRNSNQIFNTLTIGVTP